MQELSYLNGIDLEFTEDEDCFIVERLNKYFRLGKLEGNILKQLYLNQNVEHIQYTYEISEQELISLLNELKLAGIIGSEKKEKQNILFYKIPIFNPGKFLDIVVSLFFKRKSINYFMIGLITAISILGIILFVYDFNDLTAHFLKDFKFIHFVLFYIVTIITIFLHEIGHALACKYFGGKVKEIGFLLLFFSPALYCDVSGIRMFKKKQAKIITLLAGIFVQIFILSIMSILYHFIYEGSSFIATFALWNLIMVVSNIVPFIKLDGYWILSSWVNIPNLYEKSLKYALGNKSGVLFNERERRYSKFVKVFGVLNISFVFVSIVIGFVGLYILYVRLDGVMKYVILTVETLMYLLLLVFFANFLIKLMKRKQKT